MSLINFKSTTYFKAFFLYALVAAISASLAIEFRLELENSNSSLFKLVAPLTPEQGISHLHKILVTIIITFISSFAIYNLIYLLFGWGGGMLVSKNNKGKYL